MYANTAHRPYDERMDRTFFITSVTAQRRAIFRHDPTATLFMETLLSYRLQGKYLLHEFVIMPDHFHAILTPAEEISLEKVVQFIKGGFSHRLHSRLPVWQAGFANQRIHDLEDFERHRNYVWMNPVRAKLVVAAKEYSYCSAGRAFEMDSVPPGLKPRLLAG
jgi:putative transposase